MQKIDQRNNHVMDDTNRQRLCDEKGPDGPIENGIPPEDSIQKLINEKNWKELRNITKGRYCELVKLRIKLIAESHHYRKQNQEWTVLFPSRNQKKKDLVRAIDKVVDQLISLELEMSTVYTQLKKFGLQIQSKPQPQQQLDKKVISKIKNILRFITIKSVIGGVGLVCVGGVTFILSKVCNQSKLVSGALGIATMVSLQILVHTYQARCQSKQLDEKLKSFGELNKNLKEFSESINKDGQELKKAE